MTRSKPGGLARGDRVGQRLARSRCRRRASRASACRCSGASIAFMRMRSPSSAPPDLRRDGSIEMIAICSRSSWSSRKRRTSSSVSELLPAPPVPVMPSTGVVAARAAARAARRAVVGGTAPLRARVIDARERARARAAVAVGERAIGSRQSLREVEVARARISLIMPCRPEPLAVLRREDPRDAVVVQLLDLGGHDHAAAAAEHLDVRRRRARAAGRACT